MKVSGSDVRCGSCQYTETTLYVTQFHFIKRNTNNALVLDYKVGGLNWEDFVLLGVKSEKEKDKERYI